VLHAADIGPELSRLVTPAAIGEDGAIMQVENSVAEAAE
jgi:hypothetical protein